MDNNENLTKEERKNIRRKKFYDVLDHVFNVLNVVSMGTRVIIIFLLLKTIPAIFVKFSLFPSILLFGICIGCICLYCKDLYKDSKDAINDYKRYKERKEQLLEEQNKKLDNEKEQEETLMDELDLNPESNKDLIMQSLDFCNTKCDFISDDKKAEYTSRIEALKEEYTKRFDELQRILESKEIILTLDSKLAIYSDFKNEIQLLDADLDNEIAHKEQDTNIVQIEEDDEELDLSSKENESYQRALR